MGGSQYQAKLLTEYMAAGGRYDVHYLARWVSPEFVPGDYLIRQIADPTGFRRFGAFLDAFDLLRILKEISPDAIYQRVGCGYTGIAAYYAKEFNKRCVWHVASDRDVAPFDWKISKNMFFRYADKLFAEYGLRNASAIVTQTQHQADLLWKHYGRMADAIVPNVHPWPTESVQKPPTPITVIWVANIKPLKRPELFIRLAKDLRELEGVQFVMIGRPLGNQAWCQEIEAEARRLDNMRYLGGQPQDVVNEMLSKAHIFVNTSEYEGLANTCIQAWLRKVPVVSLSVNPDGVLDRHNVGICAKSYEKMTASVARLIKDQGLRLAMGEAAQAFAKENYSEKNLETLVNIIRGNDDAKDDSSGTVCTRGRILQG